MNKREMLKRIIENWFVEKTSIKPTEDGLNNLVDRIYYNKKLTLGGVGNTLKCDFCGADEIYPNLDIRLYQCKCGATKSF